MQRAAIPFLLALALSGLPGFPLQAAADSDHAMPEDWAAEEERLRARIAAVNDGVLTFLDGDKRDDVHHHAGHIRITTESLHDGWVSMQQCHANLDAVPAAQIIFNPDSSRALEVVSARNVDEAYADGSSIQLRGVGDDSEVCLQVESRAMHRIADGVYELKNGPFMRRFLDGYYPLRVSLSIEYPSVLDLLDHLPEKQPGFEVAVGTKRVDVEATFEGQLRTAFRFIER
jgi:hypothetical protein